MAKKTDLKLINVEKQAKEIHSLETHTFDDGTTLRFYVTFPHLLIEEMLEELQKHYIDMKQHEIELSEKMNLYFINLLIIKYMTHLKDQFPDTVLAVGKKSGMLDWLNHFADTGLMKTIIDEVFLPEQVRKVYDKLTEFLGTSLLLQELGEMTQRHLENMKFKHNDEISKLENSTIQ